MKYLHISHISKAEQLLDSKTIDNSLINPNESFTRGEFKICLPMKGRLKPVKAFLRNISKIQESQYTRNAPWVDDKFIKKERKWNYLWFIPRYIDVYKIEEFRAFTFDISARIEKILEHAYMEDVITREQFYFESQSVKAVEMINMEEKDIHEVCNMILWMKKPYATYKFKEWYDNFTKRRLKSLSKTYSV